MKKSIKIISILILFLGIVPSLAGVAITYLWNAIITAACGFATISFWQGVGIFILGQIVCGGFILGAFMIAGSIHRVMHNSADWSRHMHNMTEEQRREFIHSRRQHFGFHNNRHAGDNGTER